MANKKRGIAAERELLHLLFSKGFMVARVAGSGSIPEPSCDLLAGNVKRKYAIEVKSSQSNKKYFVRQQVKEFTTFSKHFGLTPLIAIKFSRRGWFFIKPEQLDKTSKALMISLDKVQKIGKSFDELTQ